MSTPRLAVKQSKSINSQATCAVINLFFKNLFDVPAILEQEQAAVHDSFELSSTEPKLCSTGNYMLTLKSVDPVVCAAFKNAGVRVMQDSQSYKDYLAKTAAPSSADPRVEPAS